MGWVTDEMREKPRKNRYVWLGHKANINTLLPYIDGYGDELTIISNIKVKGVNCIDWYEGAEELLINYEFLLLPQPDQYKSPNRLVDGILAGCKVITFDAPAYKAFEGRNVDYFKQMFSIAKIAQDWINAFTLALTVPKDRVVCEEKETKLHPTLEGKKFVRLNIGCGVKIYPKKEGWVNIDLINHPDIDLIHDVRNISKTLGKSIADEIHAYHLVEHITPSDLQPMLKDWYEMLKPGGRIVVEMPDFIKCAKNILQFETTEDRTLWFDYGLKGFYGEYDSNSKTFHNDLHKWLYTFKTFKPELEKAGFTKIEEQTPVTHQKVRDFRIVGYKK
jgi:hypothetical protein